jgi:hypothetical protein
VVKNLGDTMEKAYDIKELGLKLKAKGLDIAEESLKIIVEESFDWLEESAKLSPNMYDDMMAMVYPQAKSYVIAQVDKLDGEVG